MQTKIAAAFIRGTWLSVAADGTRWMIDDHRAIFRVLGSSARPVGGSLTRVAVGGADRVWGVCDGTIWRRSGAGWVQVPGSLVDIDVAADGTVWGTNTARNIYRWNGGDWDRMPGALQQVAVGSAAHVWGTNEGNIWRWTGSDWVQAPGGLVNIDVGADGTVCGVNAGGQAFRWTGSDWTPLGAPGLVQVSVASAGEIHGIDANGNLVRWSGASWDRQVVSRGWHSTAVDGTRWLVDTGDRITRIGPAGAETVGGQMVQVGVGRASQIWGVNRDEQIFRRVGEDWRRVAGALVQVDAASDGTVWGVNCNGNIYRWTGTDWQPIAGGLVQIAVGSAGEVWGINAAGMIYRWGGGDWQPIHGGLANIDVGADGTVVGVNAAGVAYRWTGSNWLALPGMTLARVSVASAREIHGADPAGNLVRWDGAAWVPVDLGVQDPPIVRAAVPCTWLSAAADGTRWMIDDHRALSWMLGSSTQPVDGSLTRVAVGAAERVWGVCEGTIWRRSGGGWVQVPGSLVDIDVAADGTVWGTNTARNIYRWNGGDWDRMPGALQQVAVGSAAHVWGTNDGNIWRWTGSDWVQAPGGLVNIDVGADGTVAGVNAAGQAFRWTGSDWTPLGAPGLVQVSVASAGEIYGVGAGGNIVRWSGAAWMPDQPAHEGRPPILTLSATGDRPRGLRPLKRYGGGGHPDGVCAASTVGEQEAFGAGYAVVCVEGYVLERSSQATMPLRCYRNATRDDSVLVATAAGEEAARAAGYQMARVEGHVLPAEPPGVAPLKVYRAPNGQDSLTVATVAGEQAAVAAGYRFQGVEGHVYTTQRPGTVPLNLYRNVALPDHYITAETGSEAGADHAWVRTEGYVLSAQQPGTVPLQLHRHPIDGRHRTVALGIQAALGDGVAFVRVVGYVLPAVALPAGIAPLRTWWSSDRKRHRTTATEAGALEAIAGGYQLVRTEGYVYAPTGNDPVRTPPATGWLSAAADGACWAVDDLGAVRQLAQLIPRAVPGTRAHVAAGSASQVWSTDCSDRAYRLRDDGSTWELMPGAFARVDVAADGTVWGTSAAGDVYHWNDGWHGMPGPMAQVAVGGATQVWGVDRADHIHRWDGRGWVQMASGPVDIDVGADGAVWGTSRAGDVYRWNGGGWDRMPGQLAQVTVGSATLVCGVDLAGKQLRWDGAEWRPLRPAVAQAIESLEPTVTRTWQITVENQAPKIYHGTCPRGGGGGDPFEMWDSGSPISRLDVWWDLNTICGIQRNFDDRSTVGTAAGALHASLELEFGDTIEAAAVARGDYGGGRANLLYLRVHRQDGTTYEFRAGPGLHDGRNDLVRPGYLAGLFGRSGSEIDQLGVIVSDGTDNRYGWGLPAGGCIATPLQAQSVWEITLYDAPNLTGASIVYHGPATNLAAGGWNDRIRSFKILAGMWFMYRDPEYGGEVHGPFGPGEYRSASGWPAGAISSLRPLPVGGLAVFTEEHFRGAMTTWTTDVPTLDGRVGSLIVTGGTWVLHTDPGHDGDGSYGPFTTGLYRTRLDDQGRPLWGAGDGAVRSIRQVPSNGITLYAKPYYCGEMLSLDDSCAELPADFQARTASMIVLSGTWALYKYGHYHGQTSEDSAGPHYWGPFEPGYYPNYLNPVRSARRHAPVPPVIPAVSDAEKVRLLTAHAPRIWLAEGERFFPASVEWAFPYFQRFSKSDPDPAENGKFWLRTRQALSKDTDDSLPVFRGNRDLAQVPVYAFWTARGHEVDLHYFFYYPYNKGKQILLGFAPSGILGLYPQFAALTPLLLPGLVAFSVLGFVADVASMLLNDGLIFGNHVGDWEKISIRLAWARTEAGWELRPTCVNVTPHDLGFIHPWNAPHGRGMSSTAVNGTHPVLYSADGSHGSWADDGIHYYKRELEALGIYDSCSPGTPWDTWNNVVPFEVDLSNPTAPVKRRLAPLGASWPAWLNDDVKNAGNGDPGIPGNGPIFRWGNPAGAFNLAGQYRLEDGPTGPMLKDMWKSDPDQFE